MATNKPRTQTNAARSTDDRRWPAISWKDSKRRWCVDGRIGTDGENGGKREFFVTRAEADERRRELRTERGRGGDEAIEIPTGLRVEALRCSARLSARGKTLTDATNFLIKHLDQEKKSILWSELVKLVVDSKRQAGLADRYTQDLESRLTMLATDREDRPVTDYATDELEKWLLGMTVRKPGHRDFGKPLGPTSRNNTRRLLVLAWNEAIARGFADSNPAEKLPVAKPPRPDDDEEGEDEHEVTMQDILLPVEIAVLLLAAEPELVPYLALAAFCGLRRQELKRISWRRIEWDKCRIYIPERVAKRSARWVQLRVAHAFLLPYKGRTGLITPSNFRESLDRARARAADLLDAHKIEGRLAAWPQNCLRHGFASYHYARFDDAKGLASELGHRSTDLIFRVYREPAPRELAEQFWSISPTLIERGRSGGVTALLESIKIQKTLPQRKRKTV